MLIWHNRQGIKTIIAIMKTAASFYKKCVDAIMIEEESLEYINE